MATANQLTDVRELWDGGKGHNFGLPDCIKFIQECYFWDEKPNFWDIAAITGDTVAQVYNRNDSSGCEYCVSGFLAGQKYLSCVFNTLGYNHEYVCASKIVADKAHYQRKIAEYIDNGIPVLVVTNINDIPAWHSDVGTYCLIIGYENDGQVLKLLVCNSGVVYYEVSNDFKLDLVFVEGKQREVPIEELYISTIMKIPYWLSLPERDGMCFGAAAFRAWADDIEAGRFDNENLALWENYGVYVCNQATSCDLPIYTFKELASADSEYSKFGLVGNKLEKLFPFPENPSGFSSVLWMNLEELQAGMNMNEVKATMRDSEKRTKAATALRDNANLLDEAMQLLIGLIQ